ncbi:MAG: flagellar biosynthesis anti-sigma factor FlgM [Candidatus Sericytochromatia bacterium]|jgi:negative regulator of flagellin synthesis FlgM|nr:flagellar biosynthesis anti-sigma factor FlgM [Candidatus Sericytochromatia bacterium]
MRISNEQAQQILAAQGVKGPKAVKGQAGPAPTTAPASDAVSVSSKGQEIGKALQALAGLPDVRADKVAALKAQIEAGTYQVSGRDIAESLLRRASDKLI